MDTSETYIEMCEKAEEIQAHDWKWDELWYDKFNQLIKHYNPLENIDRENRADNRDYYWQQSDNMVWLPRQDQLQEMLRYYPKDKPSELIYGNLAVIFGDWLRMKKDLSIGHNPSMEQLWLCFLMETEYDKIWNGQDWIKDGRD